MSSVQCFKSVANFICKDLKIIYLKSLKDSVFFFAQQLFQSLQMLLPRNRGEKKKEP